MTKKPQAVSTLPPSPNEKFRPIDLWLAAAIALVTLAAFATIGKLGFLFWDDNLYVFENSYVVRGLTADGLRWSLTTGHASNWHPLTWWSHMLDVQLFGQNPAAHHSVSLWIHVVNSLLLFGLLRRMGGAPGRSAFVAALFAVHPMHVESVAWLSERKDVLSGLFFMLTCWAYVEYARRRTPARYIVVLVLFALGLMAKPMLVTLPFVLLLLDVWPLGRVWKEPAPADALSRIRSALPRLAFEKLPLFALAAASAYVTYAVQQRSGSVAEGEWVPATTRLFQPVIAYGSYIMKLLVPVNLSAFYPFPRTLVVWQLLLAAVVLVGVTVLVFRAIRRPYLMVGWLWFLGMLVPVIGWVQVGQQAMADRYTYLPYIGLFVMAAWGIAEALATDRVRTMALAAAGVAIVAACAFLTWKQVPYWRDGGALWARALEVTRDNYFAHFNLGVAMAYAGKPAEAMVEYTKAAEINPRFPMARNNMGVTLLDYGRVDDAIVEFEKALELAPRYTDAHRNLGKALATAGRFDEAVEHLRASLDGGPDDALTYIETGIALARQGRIDDAIVQYRNALRLRPDHPAAHNNLGTALERRGRVEDAIQHYLIATRLNPDYAIAQSNLGSALFRIGRDHEAIPYFETALRLQPDQPGIHNSLGAALANEGRLQEAIPHFQEALRLQPDDLNARSNLDSALVMLRRQ